ncbi:MAG: PHP domain-containing protein [bacterium]|nr:PHP domain-containing protein [bacterium]
MDYIDLHVHSNVSDGTSTPSELVAYAYEKRLKAFALTDHDTVDGVKEAVDAAKRLATDTYELTVVPGVEISAAYNGKDIHILGLFLDYENKILVDTLHQVADERKRRNEKMCKNLQDAGILITMEDITEGNEDAVITRAHFAKALLKKGYVKEIKDAFTKYLDASGPYYVPREYLSPKTAIDLILSAGGIPVLAHPLLYKLSSNELKTLVKELKGYGLQGIEAVYSCNKGLDESYVRSIARENNLAVSGGSDYHGSVKPDIDLGTGRGNLKVQAFILDDLIALKEKK